MAPCLTPIDSEYGVALLEDHGIDATQVRSALRQVGITAVEQLQKRLREWQERLVECNNDLDEATLGYAQLPFTPEQLAQLLESGCCALCVPGCSVCCLCLDCM